MYKTRHTSFLGLLLLLLVAPTWGCGSGSDSQVEAETVMVYYAMPG